jgi:hypothetical protein
MTDAMIATCPPGVARPIKRFPEFRNHLQKSKSPYAYWIELQFASEKADEDLTGRISNFAIWCLNQPRAKAADDDLPTVVTVCFLEHIPVDVRLKIERQSNPIIPQNSAFRL